MMVIEWNKKCFCPKLGMVAFCVWFLERHNLGSQIGVYMAYG